jgi:hypothetical protein
LKTRRQSVPALALVLLIAASHTATDVPASSWNFDGFTDLSLRVQGTIVPVELQSLAVD